VFVSWKSTTLKSMVNQVNWYIVRERFEKTPILI